MATKISRKKSISDTAFQRTINPLEGRHVVADDCDWYGSVAVEEEVVGDQFQKDDGTKGP